MITEVITTADFHPTHAHQFLYATSRGTVKIGDIRQRANVSQPTATFSSFNGNKNIFSEMMQGISCAKFTKDGRFIVCRDYMSILIWDVNMPTEPMRRFPVHDYLAPKLCDLFDSESIYDKFDFCMNKTGRFACAWLVAYLF